LARLPSPLALVQTLANGFPRARLLAFALASVLRNQGTPLADLRVALRRIPQPCPQCGERLRPQELRRHLWHQHGTTPTGSPWLRVRRFLHAGQLNEATALARTLDPQLGSERVQRWWVRRQPHDSAARSELRQSAERRGLHWCPQCAQRSPPARVPPAWLRHGRLLWGDYGVRIDERGLFAHVRIHTPTQAVYDGNEPGRYWTWRGLMLVGVLPLVVLAHLLAMGLSAGVVTPLLPVGVLLNLAFIGYFYQRVRWQSVRSLDDRAVDYAWTLLLPQLDPRRDADCLAGLAQTSVGRGTPAWRVASLETLIARTLPPTRRYLQALQAADAHVLGQPVRAVPAAAIVCPHCGYASAGADTGSEV
jgi:predicted RNA-binding Zn-ribbon protein involved in translation (DUF1610 family)